ncbi:WD40 repeat-like protein [Bimuria novae-zelandiae CBS 107.79]|uniref:WD40 repeat-like protein n=1 Tax=Bimuria novae-zelandiae CBS 107.79 TaxID=1447943 RepID=A0A6A5VKS6_9PLEO|nr:WD40 repeat-like protein [Bimuria novae-zelandiae CBS 107.79]
MNDSDDDNYSCASGYATPPLSPSKTVSTEGWLSPKTPASPHKTQSCIFPRQHGFDDYLATPPGSPTKLKLPSRLAALQLEDAPKFNPGVTTQLSSNDSPIKRLIIRLDEAEAFPRVPFDFPNAPSRSEESGGRRVSAPPQDTLSVPQRRSLDNRASEDHTSTASLYLSAEEELTSPTTASPESPHPNCENPLQSANCLPSPGTASLAILGRLPIRSASSPLRPSQWVARGGLLTTPPRPSHAPDRFIPPRRPPNMTKQSFDLNKPEERLEIEGRAAPDNGSSSNPFSRHLRRSVRMNNELHGLRESHAMLTGRLNINRPRTNPRVRRGTIPIAARQISAGAVWNVGGPAAASDTVLGVFNGSGGLLGTGTNAPLYTSMFLSRSDPDAELEAYERRLALALDIDQVNRVLDHSASNNSSATTSSRVPPLSIGSTVPVWRDNAWSRDVLDAPQLRDDYYCSVLAYSHNAKYLAVGLGNFVHLWSERKGVDTPESLNVLSTTGIIDVQHVTSLSFSSTQGGQAILAVARADGRITLWSPFDSEPRFDATQPKPISCIAFKPTIVKKPSLRDNAMTVPTEELLVGDEAGHIYFYSIEWPTETESAIFGWNGAMTLLARMEIHSQQICGLAWSPDGDLFASGGNDNACYLFETRKVLRSPNPDAESTDTVNVRRGLDGENIYSVTPGRSLQVQATQAKHKWELNAAVKAIAFCPWQRGLLAIGGGSNDRCIHFYHTMSGACLATIDCAAQVTSLIWSQTRREIAATFGFAQPEHPFRIAVFAWPSCEQVVAVPWFDESRALYAIPYPGGPQDTEISQEAGRSLGEDGVWSRRGAKEGCIVVAASDAAIRFHEIWTGGKKGMGNTMGLLGGSGILESLHGIEWGGGPTIR